MKAWTEHTLGELVTLITKGTTPSTVGFDFLESGVNYIRAEGISKEGYVDSSTFNYISEECHEKLSRSKLQVDDILFSIAGMSLGKTGIVKEEYLPANTNQAVAIIRVKKEKCEPKFIQYYFINPVFYKTVNSISAQSAQPNINLKQIGDLKINLPDITIQQSIASILSAYDDLIENNLKRIKLLEEAAQNIYKEWFVHLRFPGYEDAEFENGLPKGWQPKKLGSVAILHYGKSLKADERVSGKYPVYGSSGIVGFHNTFLTRAPGIIVGRKGNVGSIFWTYENFFPIDTVYYVESEFSMYFLYFNLKDRSYVNSDSAVPGLNRSYAHQLDIVIPSQQSLQEFDSIVEKLFLQISNLRQQNQKLKEARDILLPRLMNRTIEVE